MHKLFVVASMCSLFSFSGLAFSAEKQIVYPGMYEVASDALGQPFKTKVCYSDADVKDLSSFLLKMEDQLMQNKCEVEILSSTDGKAEWRTECKTDFVTRTTVGSIVWDKDHFSGSSHITMGRVEIDYKFDALRVGDCK